MSADPAIPALMTLPALQQHIHDLCAARGWDKNTAEQRFLLLVEEVGELAKVMRKATNLQTEQNNPAKPVWTGEQIRAGLAEEFADVLMYTFDLANVFGIDLEQAYRDKVAATAKRVWA